MAGFKKLDVYERTYKKLEKEIYEFSLTTRALQNDTRANVAEGYGRNKSDKDKINFLNDALGLNDEMLFT